MTTVFIGGSRHLRRLDDAQLLNALDKIMVKNHRVLVGDAVGVDESVQRYFAGKGYGNVVVRHMGDYPRKNHNPGDWEIRRVEDKGERKNFKYFALKDEEMSLRADYGLMLWDGKSKGTLNNVLNLLEEEKYASVYFSPDRSFTTVSTAGELNALLEEKCPPEAVDYFNKKIHLARRVRNLGQANMFFGHKDARTVPAVYG